MRIRNWHFTVRQHREMVSRNVVVMQDPGMLEQVSKNITRNGMTNFTLNYLRVSIVFYMYIINNYMYISSHIMLFPIFFPALRYIRTNARANVKT